MHFPRVLFEVGAVGCGEIAILTLERLHFQVVLLYVSLQAGAGLKCLVTFVPIAGKLSYS